jgi:rRNA biogenesis protein RRP5
MFYHDKDEHCQNFYLLIDFYREEQEKMNVWIAYLNLENMYGTPEELTTVLQRALQQNEALTLYQHLINIYSKSGKFQASHSIIPNFLVYTGNPV